MLIDVIQNDSKIYINGTKKVLTPLINDKRFKKKLKKAIVELNELLIIFIEANGYNLKDIQEKSLNLNDILASNKEYENFISKYLSLQQTVESAQYISENPIYLQRKIEKGLSELKSLVKKLYPDFKAKHKVTNFGTLILSFTKKTLFFLLLLILLVFLALAAYILVQELLIRL